MSSKKAVLFDLDGTLLDTLDDLSDAVNYIMKKYGFPTRDRWEVRSFLGSGAAALIKSALPDYVDNDTFKKCLGDYQIYYRENSQIKTGPYSGVLDAMKRLKDSGVAVCVVSNKPDLAVGKLCRAYFGDLVDFTIGDREDIERKPSADPVIFTMKATKTTSAVFVGDSEVDIYTAKNAGIPCVSVTWGFRDKAELLAAGGDIFADDAEMMYQEIVAALNSCDAGGCDASN